MRKIFKGWAPFEIAWLCAFSAIAIVLSIVWKDTFFGYSVFLTGVICVVLVARGSIWNYAWGTYNVIGYSWLSYQNGFFGELTLNAGYFLPMQLVGFLMWRKRMLRGEATSAIVSMKRQTIPQMIMWFLISAAATLIYGYFLSRIPSQNSPYLDAASTVLSVIAMILMALRFAEQWIYWIVIDIISVIMWSLRLGSGVEGSTTMLIMWSAYLVNAVYGYYKWLKGARLQKESMDV